MNLLAFFFHMRRDADLQAQLDAARIPADEYVKATETYEASSLASPLTPGVTIFDLAPYGSLGWIRFNLIIAAKRVQSSNVNLKIREIVSERTRAGHPPGKAAMAEIKAQVVADELTRTPVTRKAHQVWIKRINADGSDNDQAPAEGMRDTLGGGAAYAGFIEGKEKQLDVLAMLMAKAVSGPLVPATIDSFLATAAGRPQLPVLEGTTGRTYPGLVGESKDAAGVFMTWLWSQCSVSGNVDCGLSNVAVSLRSPFVFHGNPETGPEVSTFKDGKPFGDDVRACIRVGKILASAGLALAYGVGYELRAFSPYTAIVDGLKPTPEPEGTDDVFDAAYELWFHVLPRLYRTFYNTLRAHPGEAADSLHLWREMVATD